MNDTKKWMGHENSIINFLSYYHIYLISPFYIQNINQVHSYHIIAKNI